MRYVNIILALLMALFAFVVLRHGVGVAHVDLGGRWVRDADVDFQVVLGDGELTVEGAANGRGARFV